MPSSLLPRRETDRRRGSARLAHRLWLQFVMVLIALFALCPWESRAQCAGDWAPGTGVPGTNSRVNALARSSVGDLIVGGDFTVAGETQASRIARYTSLTGQWSSLGSGPDGRVNAIGVLPDGDIIAAGSFQTAGGAPASNIARFNVAAGTWSPLGLGVAGTVNAIATLPGGDVVVGGALTGAGGAPALNIARYTFSSGAWSTIGAGTNSAVFAMTTLPGGDLLVGGTFTSAGGAPAGRLARLNPVTGTWTGLSPGANGAVYALAVLENGDAVVAGNFTSVGGVSASSIVRYSPAAGTWTQLGAGITNNSGGARNVYALAALPGDLLLVGGDFLEVSNNIFVAATAVYNFQTGIWSAPGFGTWQSQGELAVRALLVVDPTHVVAGGAFTLAGGTPATFIASYDTMARTWESLGLGTSNQITDMATMPDGRIIAAGRFRSIGGTRASGVAAFDPSDGVWSAVGPPPPGAVDGVPRAVAGLPNGDVLVAGTIRVGFTSTRFARLDAATNSWSAIDTGPFPPLINDLAVLPSGDVVVAGSFNRIGSVTDASGLALYRPSTNTWASLGVGANGAIDVLLLLPDGDLLAGGRFSMAGGVSAQGIARFHPASNAWSPLGSGVGGHVNAIALLSGGHTVIVGGRFASSGNVTLANLAIYDFSTGLWSDAGGGVSGYPSDSAYPVAALAVLGNGEVIIGGQFLAAGGQAAPHVARYDPISNTLSPVGTGSDAQVVSAISVGGDVLLGGDFTVVDDQVLAYVARYTIRPDCAADFDCDGFVNSQDFFGYLVAFFGGAPLADFDHDGFINSQDFFGFVAAFFSGC